MDTKQAVRLGKFFLFSIRRILWVIVGSCAVLR
jgi:hypothetical protein